MGKRKIEIEEMLENAIIEICYFLKVLKQMWESA